MYTGEINIKISHVCPTDMNYLHEPVASLWMYHMMTSFNPEYMCMTSCRREVLYYVYYKMQLLAHTRKKLQKVDLRID